MTSLIKQENNLFDLPLPDEVNVYIETDDNKACFKGVFYSPGVAKKMGLDPVPTIIIMHNEVVEVFVHEIGHYIHWSQNREDFGVFGFVFKDKKADELGMLWYSDIVGECIDMSRRFNYNGS